jgi:hypothetical protein
MAKVSKRGSSGAARRMERAFPIHTKSRAARAPPEAQEEPRRRELERRERRKAVNSRLPARPQASQGGRDPRERAYHWARWPALMARVLR